MSSCHLGQHKGNFYIIDEVFIANLSPAKAPVTRMQPGPKAMIIWSDLSPQFFCIDATLLCKFEINKI